MEHDRIFRDKATRRGDFEFDAEVAEVFDDMLVRSIPFYLEQQCMIRDFGKRLWIPGTNVYDLGCSTATTMINLCRAIDGPAHFIGYDNSLPMIDQSNKKIKNSGLEDRIEVRYGDLNGDLSIIPLENASIVTMCWTLQFIRPLRRDDLIRWIYDGLVENGAMILTEKVLTNDSHVNRFFIDFYYDFKKRNKYSWEEIRRKREALENILIPYRIDENMEMLKRNGFKIVESFFQWYNFIGFICIKKT